VALKRLAEGVPHGFVWDHHLLVAPAPAQVGVDRATLDRARPDQRDLHHQVVEILRPQPRQGGHLGAGLDLEHAHRVGSAEHLVDRGVFLRDGMQVPSLAVMGRHQVEAVVQAGQHAQAEQVDLDQSRVGAVILVPLQHAAARHPRPLHRAHLAHRPIADHHPAGVDAQVPGQPLHLGGQFRHRLGDGHVLADRLTRADVAGPCVLLPRRVAERPRRVAQRHPRPVGDDVRDLGGPVPPVPPVDVLDHFLAAAVLDIQVDVGWTVPARGQEPLEEQPMLNGIHAGDPQREADG